MTTPRLRNRKHPTWPRRRSSGPPCRRSGEAPRASRRIDGGHRGPRCSVSAFMLACATSATAEARAGHGHQRSGGARRRRGVSAGATLPISHLVLPGQTTAFIDTPIYARASGYLKALEFRHRRARPAGPSAGRTSNARKSTRQLRQARAQPGSNAGGIGSAGKHGTCQGSRPAAPRSWSAKAGRPSSRATRIGGVTRAASPPSTWRAPIVQAQQARGRPAGTAYRLTNGGRPFDGFIIVGNTDLGRDQRRARLAGHRTVRHDCDHDAAHLRRGARGLFLPPCTPERPPR